MNALQSITGLFSRKDQPSNTRDDQEQRRIRRIEAACKGEKGHNTEGVPTYLFEAKSLFTTGPHLRRLELAKHRHPDIYKYVNVVKSLVASWTLYTDAQWQHSIVQTWRRARLRKEDFVQVSKFPRVTEVDLGDTFIGEVRKEFDEKELEDWEKRLAKRKVDLGKLFSDIFLYHHLHVAPKLKFACTTDANLKTYSAVVQSYNGSNEQWKRFNAYYFGDGANSEFASGNDLEGDQEKGRDTDGKDSKKDDGNNSKSKDLKKEKDSKKDHKIKLSFDDLLEIDSFDVPRYWGEKREFARSVVVRESQTNAFIWIVASGWAFQLLGKSLLAGMVTNIPKSNKEHADPYNVKGFAEKAVLDVLPFRNMKELDDWVAANRSNSDDVLFFLSGRNVVWNMVKK